MDLDINKSRKIDEQYELFDLDSVHDCLYQGGKWGGQIYSSEDNAIYNLDSILKERIDFFYLSEADISRIKEAGKDPNTNLIFSNSDNTLNTSGNGVLNTINIKHIDDKGEYKNSIFFEYFKKEKSGGGEIEERIIDIHDNFFISKFKHPMTISSFFDSSTSYCDIRLLEKVGNGDHYLHQSLIRETNPELGVGDQQINNFWKGIVDHIFKNYFHPNEYSNVKEALKKFNFVVDANKFITFTIGENTDEVEWKISQSALAEQINKLTNTYDTAIPRTLNVPDAEDTTCVNAIAEYVKNEKMKKPDIILLLRLLKFIGDESHIYMCSWYNNFMKQDKFINSAFMTTNDRMAIGRSILYDSQCIFPDLSAFYNFEKLNKLIEQVDEPPNEMGRFFGIFKTVDKTKLIGLEYDSISQKLKDMRIYFMERRVLFNEINFQDLTPLFKEFKRDEFFSDDKYIDDLITKVKDDTFGPIVTQRSESERQGIVKGMVERRVKALEGNAAQSRDNTQKTPGKRDSTPPVSPRGPQRARSEPELPVAGMPVADLPKGPFQIGLPSDSRPRSGSDSRSRSGSRPRSFLSRLRRFLGRGGQPASFNGGVPSERFLGGSGKNAHLDFFVSPLETFLNSEFYLVYKILLLNDKMKTYSVKYSDIKQKMDKYMELIGPTGQDNAIRKMKDRPDRTTFQNYDTTFSFLKTFGNIFSYNYNYPRANSRSNSLNCPVLENPFYKLATFKKIDGDNETDKINEKIRRSYFLKTMNWFIPKFLDIGKYLDTSLEFLNHITQIKNYEIQNNSEFAEQLQFLNEVKESILNQGESSLDKRLFYMRMMKSSISSSLYYHSHSKKDIFHTTLFDSLYNSIERLISLANDINKNDYFTEHISQKGGGNVEDEEEQDEEEQDAAVVGFDNTPQNSQPMEVGVDPIPPNDDSNEDTSLDASLTPVPSNDGSNVDATSDDGKSDGTGDEQNPADVIQDDKIKYIYENILVQSNDEDKQNIITDYVHNYLSLVNRDKLNNDLIFQKILNDLSEFTDDSVIDKPVDIDHIDHFKDSGFTVDLGSGSISIMNFDEDSSSYSFASSPIKNIDVSTGGSILIKKTKKTKKTKKMTKRKILKSRKQPTKNQKRKRFTKLKKRT